MFLTSARTPAEYLEAFQGWQAAYVRALREVAVAESAGRFDERLKWGHLVYFIDGGPVLLIRAEPERVLFGFWRGKRMRHIEPRLSGTSKYDMATLELRQATPFDQDVARALVREAVRLADLMGDATASAKATR
jgi:hypothetical protein